MTKAEKADFVIKTLEKLYPDPAIPLDFYDPFTCVVAVLLSAQCTDKRVNTVLPELFALGPTPQKMAAVPVATIESIIRPCGLSPQKSKAIAALSKIIIDRFDGEVPESFTGLESLPGVGHKTASVVMSQIFNHPAFPVDTHIQRLAYRWTLSTGASVEKTEADLKRIFPEDLWNKLHLQIIYFGREYCPARGHAVAECPICSQIGRKKMERYT